MHKAVEDQNVTAHSTTEIWLAQRLAAKFEAAQPLNENADARATRDATRFALHEEYAGNNSAIISSADQHADRAPHKATETEPDSRPFMPDASREIAPAHSAVSGIGAADPSGVQPSPQLSSGGTAQPAATAPAGSPVPKAAATPITDSHAAAASLAPVQVHSARIAQIGNVAEMRLGLRTESFGTVQIHTTVSEKLVDLSLGSERGDLRASFNAELPALQSSLQQHELRLEQVRVLSDASACQPGFSRGDGHGQQQAFRRPEQRVAIDRGIVLSQEEEIVSGAVTGLNIRA